MATYTQYGFKRLEDIPGVMTAVRGLARDVNMSPATVMSDLAVIQRKVNDVTPRDLQPPDVYGAYTEERARSVVQPIPALGDIWELDGERFEVTSIQRDRDILADRDVLHARLRGLDGERRKVNPNLDETGRLGPKWSLQIRNGTCVGAAPEVRPAVEVGQAWKVRNGYQWHITRLEGDSDNTVVYGTCNDPPLPERVCMYIDGGVVRNAAVWTLVSEAPVPKPINTEFRKATDGSEYCVVHTPIVPRCGQTWHNRGEKHHRIEAYLYDSLPGTVAFFGRLSDRSCATLTAGGLRNKWTYISGPTVPETDKEAFIRIAELETSNVPEGLTKDEWRGVVYRDISELHTVTSTIGDSGEDVSSRSYQIIEMIPNSMELRAHAARMRELITQGWDDWKTGDSTRARERRRWAK